MTDDLVRRLRDLVGQYIGDADIDDELQGAADRIEALEAALRKIADLGFWDGDRAMDIAHAALAGEKKDGSNNP